MNRRGVIILKVKYNFGKSVTETVRKVREIFDCENVQNLVAKLWHIGWVKDATLCMY